MAKFRAMKTPALILAAAILLVACDRTSIVGPKNVAQPEDPAAAAAPPSILSPQGWGPVRIGMRAQAALEATGGVLPVVKQEGSDCYYLRPTSSDSVLVMIQADRVTRIEAIAGTAPVVTDTGLTVGATERQIRERYSAELEAEPQKYLPAPAGYLTWWNQRTQQGVRYVLGADGKTERIIVGGPAIRLVEGCS